MYCSERSSWDAGGGEKAAALPKEAQQGPAFCAGCRATGQLGITLAPLQGSPFSLMLTEKSPVPPILNATCRTLTLDTRTLPGMTRIRRRYSESR